jgi:hypothetical protein
MNTAQKRSTSLHYGNIGKAGTRPPTGTTTAFLRGSTLSLYYQTPAAAGTTQTNLLLLGVG